MLLTLAASVAVLALAGPLAQSAGAEQIKFSISPYCLNDPQGNTSNGVQLNIWECKPGDRNQEFGFVRSSLEPDFWLIELKNNPSKCLADPWDSTQDGIKLEVYTCSDTGAFRWLEEEGKTPSLRTFVNWNLMAFGNKDGVEKNGNPVIMWEANRGWDQSWEMEQQLV